MFQSHGFGNISYVEAAGKAAEGIIFPCGRLLVADALPADNPQKQLLVGIQEGVLKAKFKEEVSTFGGHAFDAFLVSRRGGEAGGQRRLAQRCGTPSRDRRARGDRGDLQLLPD